MPRPWMADSVDLATPPIGPPQSISISGYHPSSCSGVPQPTDTPPAEDTSSLKSIALGSQAAQSSLSPALEVPHDLEATEVHVTPIPTTSGPADMVAPILASSAWATNSDGNLCQRPGNQDRMPGQNAWEPKSAKIHRGVHGRRSASHASTASCYPSWHRGTVSEGGR